MYRGTHTSIHKQNIKIMMKLCDSDGVTVDLRQNFCWLNIRQWLILCTILYEKFRQPREEVASGSHF